MLLYFLFFKSLLLEYILPEEHMKYLIDISCESYEGNMYAYAQEVRHGLAPIVLPPASVKTFLLIMLADNDEESLRELVPGEIFEACKPVALEYFSRRMEEQMGKTY